MAVGMNQLRTRCENLNARLERRGVFVRYEVSARYDYKALDRMTPNAAGDYVNTQDVVRIGTSGELAEFIHAMMVALDDVEMYASDPYEGVE